MDVPTKRKNAAPSTIREYWNRATFARSFEIITDLMPEEAGRELADIAKPRVGLLDTVSRTSEVTWRVERIYDFDVRIRRASGRGFSVVNYTSVKANGVIVIDKGLDRTVVRGNVRVGWLYALTILAAPLIMIGWFILLPGLAYGGFLQALMLIILAMMAYYGWQIWLDYRRLVDLIYEAVG